MKKNYLKPVMRVVRLKVRHHLLAGSPYAKQVGGNAFNGTPTGSNRSARSRGNDWWDDEE